MPRHRGGLGRPDRTGISHTRRRRPRAGRRRFYGEIAIWFEARDEEEAAAFLEYTGKKIARQTQVDREYTGPVELFEVDDRGERISHTASWDR